MGRLTSLAISVCLITAGSLFGQQENPTGTNEIAQLKQTVEQLKKENTRLREENQMLRKLGPGSTTSGSTNTDTTAANQEITTNQESKAVAETAVTSSDDKEAVYWLTALTNRRHIKTCKYYNVSRGRFCTRNEGIPCKYCGG